MRSEAWKLLEAGRVEEAAEAAAAALAADAADGDALHLQGIAAWRAGDRAAAADALRRASAVLQGPAASQALRDLCEVCRVAGALEEAAGFGARAVALNPDDADARYNLGIVRQELGDIDGAIAMLRSAIALSPQHAGAHFELAEALLLCGDFAQGWEEYEWRFRVPGAAQLMPETGAPAWSGEPVPGRLLLVADQGFGDVIQFMRYIPQARARCGELVLACSAEMDRLLSWAAPGVARFQLWQQAPRFDAYAALSSLPRLFGARLDSIFAPPAYLAPDPAMAERWRARLKTLAGRGGRRVGLVWAGRPTHGNDANRSMPLAALAPLGSIPGVTLVALQKGEAAAQVGRYFGAAPLVNLGPEIGDFADTAAIVAGLDLVVSVDTSVAHLAGALGMPTAVLLPLAPDWRWLLGRDDSPWYPSVRLYRQSERGVWTDPVARLCADIAAGWPGRRA